MEKNDVLKHQYDLPDSTLSKWVLQDSCHTWCLSTIIIDYIFSTSTRRSLQWPDGLFINIILLLLHLLYQEEAPTDVKYHGNFALSPFLASACYW